MEYHHHSPVALRDAKLLWWSETRGGGWRVGCLCPGRLSGLQSTQPDPGQQQAAAKCGPAAAAAAAVCAFGCAWAQEQRRRLRGGKGGVGAAGGRVTLMSE